MLVRMRAVIVLCGVLSFAVSASEVRSGFVVTAAASAEQIRFSSDSGVARIRVVVTSMSGLPFFDSGWRDGNVFDWELGDSEGHPVSGGSYRCVVAVRDLGGRESVRHATVDVHGGAISIDPAGDDGMVITVPPSSSKVTIVGHTGSTGVIASTSGDLSFRTGDYLAAADAERMRLTAEGKLGVGVSEPAERLDVAGRVKAEGIVFSDGSVLSSANLVAQEPAVVVHKDRRDKPAPGAEREGLVSLPAAPRAGGVAGEANLPNLRVETNANPVPATISLGGAAARYISVDRNTAGGAGQPLYVFGGASSTAAGNLAGGDLLLGGGVSSGSEFSGNVRVLASQPRTEGTGDNIDYVDRWIVVAKPKAMTGVQGAYQAVLFRTPPLAFDYPAAGRIHYTVVATDGEANMWTETGTFAFIASASGGTCQPVSSLHIHGDMNVQCQVSLPPTGGFAFAITDTFAWPVTTTLHHVYYTIENTSGLPISLMP